MKKFNGNVKQFILVNSVNYNEDSNYSVFIGNLEEMKELGVDEEQIKELDKIKVDEILLTDFVGCYIIRIA